MPEEKIPSPEASLAQREEALRQREEALAAREKQAALQSALKAHGLPEALSPFLSVPDGPEMDTALQSLTQALDAAANARVQDRLRRQPPAANTPAAPDLALRRLRAAMGLKNA